MSILLPALGVAVVLLVAAGTLALIGRWR